MTGITDHLGRIRRRIAESCARAGRDSDSVKLVAVSKGQPVAAVLEAARTGMTDFGENYLQEALPKISAAGEGPVWHFIGGIQANKTRDIARHFSWAHTVATARVAERLSAHRAFHAPVLQVCIQVLPPHAPAGRPGCPPGEIGQLAAAIADLPRIRLRGLMTVAPTGLDRPAVRTVYRGLREQLDHLNQNGHDLDTLSMGMSGDFEIAIEEGSTMVRIGTALFGIRPDH